MKNFIPLIILGLFLFSCEKEELRPNSLSSNERLMVDTTGITLFIFNGESNSVGYVDILQSPISHISPQEDIYKDIIYVTENQLQPIPELQIWNNNTNTFEDLHIGVNNILGDIVLGNSPYYYGWELELSNMVKRDHLDSVYLVKTGQCGSKISDWDSSGTLYHIMKSRIDSSLNYLRTFNRPINIVVFYSQGINDIICGTDSLIWKNLSVNHLSNIRNITDPNTKIVICKHMVNYENYNPLIESICNEDTSNLTTFINVDNCDVLDNSVMHFNRQGITVTCRRMYNKIRYSL